MIKLLDIFVDFQIILTKNTFLSWSMSDVQSLFRPLNINLLAYWYSQFLEILDNPTLYCSTGMTKPPIYPFSLISNNFLPPSINGKKWWKDNLKGSMMQLVKCCVMNCKVPSSKPNVSILPDFVMQPH